MKASITPLRDVIAARKNVNQAIPPQNYLNNNENQDSNLLGLNNCENSHEEERAFGLKKIPNFGSHKKNSF